MKPLILAIFLMLGLAVSSAVEAGERQLRARREMGIVAVAPPPSARHHRRPQTIIIAPPVHPYYYPYGYYPYVVSPYTSYYIPPAVVVTAPYFCTLHQTGWVSRAGFLDHVAGTHKLPLESAAAFCPDGIESCLFPGY